MSKKKLILQKLLLKNKKKVSVLDRLLLLIVLVGGLLVIGFVVYLVWFTATNRSVVSVLPAEQTVAYVEFEDWQLPPRLDVDKYLTKPFGLDLNELSENLPSGRLGMAWVESGATTSPVLFVRAPHRGPVLKYFKTLSPSDEEPELEKVGEQTIYQYPQGQFLFSFVGPYAFVSQTDQPLTTIYKVYSGELADLSTNPDFVKTQSNLPKNTWAFVYLNLQKTNFPNAAQLNQLINPLKHLVQHGALTLRKQSNGLHFNTLISLNPSMLALKKGFTDAIGFRNDLTDFIASENLATYLGGSDLSAEWQNTLDTISQLNPAYGIILEGLVRAQVNKYFGEDVDLRNDLYPFFEGEYALALEQRIDGLVYKLILQHDDQEFAEVKAEKLLVGFEELAAQFAPRLKVFTLPDGTESRELVADETKVIPTSEGHGGFEIRCLEIEESNNGFCYVVTDELVVMSNSSDSIKESIDLTTSARGSLSTSQAFRQSLNNLSIVKDELSYLDLERTAEVFEDTKVGPFVSPIAELFDSMAWVKHYFNDGVSTEGYLLFK